MDVCFTVCCFWIRCGICGPSQDRICFMYVGASIFRSLWCVVWLCHLLGSRAGLNSWLVVKMSRCWICFNPSTCEDRIRSEKRQGLCNKCFRSLSCHRCHACVQRSSPRMIEFFTYTWSFRLNYHIEVDSEGLSMLLISFFGSRDGFLLVATKSHAGTEDNSFCLSFLS